MAVTSSHLEQFRRRRRKRTSTMFVLVVGAALLSCVTTASSVAEVSGKVDECDCNVADLTYFNSFRVYPQIQAIVRKDYFRYFKVDLSKECPFWHDDSTCALKDCSVETCDPDEIPFVVAEKIRLGSGSEDRSEADNGGLESSNGKVRPPTGDPAEDGGHLPYYERARTAQIGSPAAVQADATLPPAVDKTEKSTLNIQPTPTAEAAGNRVTMATTVLPTLKTAAGESSASNASATSSMSQKIDELVLEDGEGDDEEADDHEDEQGSCKKHNRTLGKIDVTLSEESLKEFERWHKHDASQQDFCVFDDENSANATYVDLLLNPERFTGYAGPSANRVWKTIYEENCFKGPRGSPLDLNQMCLEKRVFYRVISGLHSSINIHLCAEYYLPKMGKLVLPGEPMWGPNLDEFESRFSAAATKGEGPQRLRNLYFLYLLELRAIHKASAFLQEAKFYTSNPGDTEETRQAVSRFLSTVKEFKSHFNESQMFIGSCQETIKLKEEFRRHFLNISSIMDCVGCDKCRLWGKLQTQGLGTALKIIFSDSELLDLTRTEVVTLFNSFAKLSNSIVQLENFNRMRKEAKGRKQGSRSGLPFSRKEEL